MTVMADNPVKSVDELKEPGGKSITLGGDNAASSNLIFATIAKEMLGLNIKVVRGYVGAAPMFLAMQRGEIDGQIVGFSSVRTGQRDLWSQQRVPPADAIRPHHAALRLSRHPDRHELTKDPNALALIDFANLPFFMSLPFAAPARRAGRPRQGAAGRVHGDVQGPGVPRRRRTNSASR